MIIYNMGNEKSIITLEKETINQLRLLKKKHQFSSYNELVIGMLGCITEKDLMSFKKFIKSWGTYNQWNNRGRKKNEIQNPD